MSRVSLLFVLVLAACGAVLSAPAVDKVVATKNTSAALLYQQPKTMKKPYKFTLVPYFPGADFQITACGATPDADKTCTIDAKQITYRQSRGPAGNWIEIYYIFATATIKINTNDWSADAKGVFTDTPMTTQTLTLSALLDGVSNPTVKVIAKANRPVAVAALDILIGHLSKYKAPTTRLKLATCLARFGEPNQPYSPKLAVLLTYLTTVRTTLATFK